MSPDAPGADAASPDIEDLYGLTPVQSGMLFHTLRDPDSGVYVVQLHQEIVGPLDPARLRSAWEAALGRHPVLRTAFVWEGLDEPLQAVRGRVQLPWTELDWRGVPPERHTAQLAGLLGDERQKGFDLSQAPLMRITLIRREDLRYHMVWTVHHLIVDGWSTVVLMDEIFGQDLTSAEDSQGSEPSRSWVLPSPPPFRTFVDWLSQRDSDADHRFWTQALSTHEQAAPLSVGRRGAAEGGPEKTATARATRKLGQELTVALQGWARSNRLTLATVIHGAWALVLRRYADGEAVTYGAVSSGRPATLPGVDRMVGPFITTVPVPMPQVEDDVGLGPWLRALQDRLHSVKEFEHCAPLDIVERRPPGTSRTLFDSVLVFESAPPSQAGAPPPASGVGLELGPARYIDQGHYDLALLVLPGAELELTAIYRTRRMDPESAEVVLGHVESVLLSMLRSPDEPLGHHAPPQGVEQARIEEIFQPSGYEGPIPDLAEFDVVERFRRWAVTDPNRLAVVGEEQAWSYGELDRHSEALARQLAEDGETGSGVRIALLAGRTPALLAGIFGILKSGSAYVPLDPSYPEERLHLMLNASGADRVVAAPDQLEHPVATKVPRLTAMHRHLTDKPGFASIPPAAQPSDLAYVIFTSGSTGTPKGVGVTRGNIAYSTWARGPVYGEVPERFLLVSPTSFDSSKVGIFWPLCSGGAVVLLADGRERDPDALSAMLRRHEVTHLLCVPTIHQWVLHGSSASDLPSLRTVIVAGEECPPALVEHHHRVLPGVRLFNEYGPTESTVWASAHESIPGAPSGPVSIGRPIPGTRLRVLDRARTAAPILVPGEIHVEGPGVTPGYLDDQELTAERFVPATGAAGSVMYRTGDLGRFHPDGRLEFLGRVDHQIKVRGHRVELREVEAALEAHPLVEAAAVTVSLNSEATESPAQLVAWLAGPAWMNVDVDAVRVFLTTHLPAHMVPDRFEVLEKLPQGPNGKIDRSNLSARMLTGPSASDRGMPETETERRLAEIWSEVLRVSVIGVEDNFFAMGGNSLLAVRLLGKIRDEFSVELPMDAVFQNPTIRTLGSRLESQPAPGREAFEF